MRNLILLLILIPFISYTQSDVPDEYWIDDADFEQKISGGAFDETDPGPALRPNSRDSLRTGPSRSGATRG